MNRFASLLFLLAGLSMAGCTTMNSDFSCKVTAKDSCLTIEEVDAMTRFADEDERAVSQDARRIKQKSRVVYPYLSQKAGSQPIWFAPHPRSRFSSFHNPLG